MSEAAQADRESEQRLFHAHYLSTACYHDLHERCRLTCKHCADRCLCVCHAPISSSSDATSEKEAETRGPAASEPEMGREESA